MQIGTSSKLRTNTFAFLWHAALLAVTVTFTDINTVLPSLILSVGGNDIHLGILTGIMVGVPLAGQLLFAGFLHTRKRKKPWLLLGIYLRVFALGLLTLIILYGSQSSLPLLLTMLYFSLLIFTVSGAFAGISYLDLVGKSFIGEYRKRFVVKRQAIMSVGTLASALLTRLILSAMGRGWSLPAAVRPFSRNPAPGKYRFLDYLREKCRRHRSRCRGSWGEPAGIRKAAHGAPGNSRNSQDRP